VHRDLETIGREPRRCDYLCSHVGVACADRSLPCSFTGRVGEQNTVAADYDNLTDDEGQESDHRKQKRELDRRLATSRPALQAVGPERTVSLVHVMRPATVSTTLLSKVDTLPVLVAHAISNMATAAAPSTTNAYSAVA
jgi:hypothetical protein